MTSGENGEAEAVLLLLDAHVRLFKLIDLFPDDLRLLDLLLDYKASVVSTMWFFTRGADCLL